MVVLLRFHGISTYMDYLRLKPSLLKDSSDTISPIAGEEYKGVHTFA